MDDCFLVFREKGHIDEFPNLNSRHRHISFTVEHELEDSFPFLDGFCTDVFRKNTYTGLGFNVNYFVPLNFKLNSIPTLS